MVIRVITLIGDYMGIILSNAILYCSISGGLFFTVPEWNPYQPTICCCVCLEVGDLAPSSTFSKGEIMLIHGGWGCNISRQAFFPFKFPSLAHVLGTTKILYSL